MIYSRPEVPCLDVLDDALAVWESESERNSIAKAQIVGKENLDSISKLKNESSLLNGTRHNRSGNVTSDDSAISAQNGASALEDFLSSANALTGKLMERCVRLADAEKTLADEPGFEVSDRRIDGKNWAVWKAQLRDALMRRELESKARNGERR